MGEIQSAKPAVSRVASRNPVSLTAQSPKPSAPSVPSQPSKPSQPSMPSGKRPVFPIIILVLLLTAAVGGLFVWRFVFKKTLIGPPKSAPVAQASPSPEIKTFRMVGDVVSVDIKENVLSVQLKASDVVYKLKIDKAEITLLSSGKKVSIVEIKKGQTVEVVTHDLPDIKKMLAAEKVVINDALSVGPVVKVGSRDK